MTDNAIKNRFNSTISRKIRQTDRTGTDKPQRERTKHSLKGDDSDESTSDKTNTTSLNIDSDSEATSSTPKQILTSDPPIISPSRSIAHYPFSVDHSTDEPVQSYSVKSSLYSSCHMTTTNSANSSNTRSAIISDTNKNKSIYVPVAESPKKIPPSIHVVEDRSLLIDNSPITKICSPLTRTRETSTPPTILRKRRPSLSLSPYKPLTTNKEKKERETSLKRRRLNLDLTLQTSGSFMQPSIYISSSLQTDNGNGTLVIMKKITSRTGHLLSRAEQLLERSFIAHTDEKTTEKE